MKKNLLKSLSIAVITLMVGAIANAGNRPEAVTISGMGSYYHFAGKRYLDSTSVPAIAVAYNFDKAWAIEGMYGVVNTQTNTSLGAPQQNVHGGLYVLDGLYRFEPYKLLEPYVAAGVGALTLIPNGTSAQHQGNLNAAVGTQLFVDQGIAFRAEARDIYTLSGGKNDYMLSLGISFLFGGQQASQVQPDASKTQA